MNFEKISLLLHSFVHCFYTLKKNVIKGGMIKDYILLSTLIKRLNYFYTLALFPLRKCNLKCTDKKITLIFPVLRLSFYTHTPLFLRECNKGK